MTTLAFILLIIICFLICFFLFNYSKKKKEKEGTRKDNELEISVCREVSEIYCNTVSTLNELCAINKQVQNTLEKFISSVSLNQTAETHQLKAIEDEVNFRIKEVRNLANILPSLRFKPSTECRTVLQKHNLSVTEVASAENCVVQSIHDMENNLEHLKEQLGTECNLLGINFSLTRLKCFQFECNALYYGALEGICTFPYDALGVYYEMSPSWSYMPKGVTLKSFDKKHFRMYQEMEFQKSQQCLEEVQNVIEGADNDIGNYINALKRRDINFFIAGSIVLQSERDVFAGVINLLQAKWKPLGLDVNSYSYMNFPREVTTDGPQEQYNHFIANHVNVAVFILSGKAGEYTLEEFNVAFNSFKERGHPKIFVYSFNNENNRCDSFIHSKMKEEKQYWIEYRNNEELRLLLERDLNNYLLDEYSKITASIS